MHCTEMACNEWITGKVFKYVSEVDGLDTGLWKKGYFGMLPFGAAEEFDEILGGLALRTEELKGGLATALGSVSRLFPTILC